MTWVQIVLLVLQLLKQLKGSESAESFAESVATSGNLPAANGDFLKWLWENREQVIEFVKIIVGMFPQNPPATTLAEDSNPVELLRDFCNE